MNTLEEINELVEKIKSYGGLTVDLYYFEEDKEELYVSLIINENYIHFLMNKDGEYFIETSLNKYEKLTEILFWKVMYWSLQYDVKE